jgi:hypothetical protein
MSNEQNTQADTQNKSNANQSLVSEVSAKALLPIKDAYEFLTKIVRTDQERADEIGRIARAAFGPIGAFVGAQISLESSQKNKSSASKK